MYKPFTVFDVQIFHCKDNSVCYLAFSLALLNLARYCGGFFLILRYLKEFLLLAFITF